MSGLLSNAGRSFIRAFIASLIVLLPGILSAPNLSDVRGLATAAVISSIAAGLKALQVFIPQLSFAAFLDNAFYGAIVDSFVRAFLASGITLLLGVLSSPDLSLTRAALTGVLIGALAAAVRAVQGFMTTGEQPAPSTGFAKPDRAPTPGEAQD